MESNITYLFGAGASYYACPIWREQAEKMEELYKFLKKDFLLVKGIDYFSLTEIDKLIWEISYFGSVSKDFNTVDTYAKKLFLSGDKELYKLKRAVSAFFTIWSHSNDSSWKELPSDFKGKYENKRNQSVDYRYINLLAYYLENIENIPRLKKNISFVTWNYDLQLEAAYNKFSSYEVQDYLKVDKYFPFIPYENKELAVLHLNGFCGFFGADETENLFKRSETSNISDILREISFITETKYKHLNFFDYINYSWDKKSVIANNIREQAIKVMEKTDILVVIGYSFPPFNNSIDNELIKAAKNLKKFVYQDPNANADFIHETFGIPKNMISIINNSLDQFVIPNYTFLEAKVL